MLGRWSLALNPEIYIVFQIPKTLESHHCQTPFGEVDFFRPCSSERKLLVNSRYYMLYNLYALLYYLQNPSILYHWSEHGGMSQNVE